MRIGPQPGSRPLAPQSERLHRQAARARKDGDLLAAAEAVYGLERAGERVVTASPGGWLHPHPLAARPGPEFVLVVLSSNTTLNHRQLEALRQARELSAELTDASVLVDALGARRLSVVGEVAPLCARGTIAGGAWSGLPVVTKGGLVGEDGTLAALVDDLWREDGWETDGRRSR